MLYVKDLKIIKNSAHCNKCGDDIESVHRHDYKHCKCGAIMVDGGKDYLRRGLGSAEGTWDDLKETSVEEPYWRAAYDWEIKNPEVYLKDKETKEE